MLMDQSALKTTMKKMTTGEVDCTLSASSSRT